VAPARCREEFTNRLSGDLSTGIEDTRDDCRVGLRDISFEKRSAIHHRYASDAHCILDDDSFAAKFATRSAFNVGFYQPCIIRIFIR